VPEIHIYNGLSNRDVISLSSKTPRQCSRAGWGSGSFYPAVNLTPQAPVAEDGFFSSSHNRHIWCIHHIHLCPSAHKIITNHTLRPDHLINLVFIQNGHLPSETTRILLQQKEARRNTGDNYQSSSVSFKTCGHFNMCRTQVLIFYTHTHTIHWQFQFIVHI
jgi:hypothetical protein